MEATGRDQRATIRAGDLPPLGLVGTVLLFSGIALVLFILARGAIPALAAWTAVEPLLLWFAVAGLGLFALLLPAGAGFLRLEGAVAVPGPWRWRLRFRAMTRADWLWRAGAVVPIGVFSAGTMVALRAVWGEAQWEPSFMMMDPLTPRSGLDFGRGSPSGCSTSWLRRWFGVGFCYPGKKSRSGDRRGSLTVPGDWSST